MFPKRKIKYRRNVFSISASSKKLITPLNNQNRKQTKADNNKDILELNIVSSSKGSTLSYIKLKFSHNLSRKAIINTVACADVISRGTLEDLKADKTVQIQSSNEKKRMEPSTNGRWSNSQCPKPSTNNIYNGTPTSLRLVPCLTYSKFHYTRKPFFKKTRYNN